MPEQAPAPSFTRFQIFWKTWASSRLLQLKETRNAHNYTLQIVRN